MYKVTFEDKRDGSVEEYDDLYGCIVAIGDEEGGYGFLDDDFEDGRATVEMLAYARAMYELGLDRMFKRFAEETNDEELKAAKYNAMKMIDGKVEEIKEKAQKIMEGNE